MNRGAWLLQNASLCVTDPRHSEELDQAVVCAEAGRAAHLQDPQKRPVGWNGAAQCLRAHREALQEGRLLLQALPPAGAVHLGRQGQSPPPRHTRASLTLPTVVVVVSSVICFYFTFST